MIHEGGYTKQQVFDAEETALDRKKTPSKTFIAREEKAMPDFRGRADSLVRG